jgi:hypothetical protein
MLALEGLGVGVGGDLQSEAQVELVGAGGSGQDELVGEAGEELRGGWNQTGCAGGQPGLRGDGDFGTPSGYRSVDFVGRVFCRGGDDRGAGSEGEPSLLFFCLARVLGVELTAGAHEARADGGDADAFVAKFGVEAFGEADEGEFAGDIGQEMGHGEFSADAGDVDDGGVAVAGLAAEQMGQRGVGGVEGGEEVGGHGSAIGGDGLVFDGADLDEAGVIDEDVDASEVSDGVLDEICSLGSVGEVGGDEENVVGGLDGFARQKGVTGAGQLFLIAGGEDELGPRAGVALSQSEAEAAGAAGDEYDLTGTTSPGPREQSIGGCGSDEASDNLGGMEDGSGLLHGFLEMQEKGRNMFIQVSRPVEQ